MGYCHRDLKVRPRFDVAPWARHRHVASHRHVSRAQPENVGVVGLDLNTIEIKLIDFGTAWHYRPGHGRLTWWVADPTRSDYVYAVRNAVGGTAQYLAPEHLAAFVAASEAEPFKRPPHVAYDGHKADVFSVGMLLFDLIASR